MALSRKPIEIVDEGKHPLLVKADHWERVYLGDIADVQNGYAFKSEFFSNHEGTPLIRIRDIKKSITENYFIGEYPKEYIVKSGDILVGMDGDFESAIWNGVDGLLNQRVCRIKLSSEYYDERFFFHCLQPFLDAINQET